jgi:hypothetical protein
MPRLRQRIPSETDSPASRLRKVINPGPSAKRQRVPGSGRRPGTSNQIPRHTQALILEALHTYGEDGSGRGGVIGLLHGAFRQDIKHAINLLVAITPKILEQNITRTDVIYKTIAELDEDLAKHGLPTSHEVFRLDFSTGPIEEAEILELAPESPVSK